MSFLPDIYYKSLAENEKNIRFWENYLQNLKALDFNIFADKLKVPALVPVGSRIFFRGELKHTNEITVALGADYFAKCSLKQAEILKQHRIKDAQSKLEELSNVKKYLENQMTFTKQNVYENQGQEIVEVYTEEQDKAWREKHKENVRKYKQSNKDERTSTEEVTDEELWYRLEELELQEELEEMNTNKEDKMDMDNTTDKIAMSEKVHVTEVSNKIKEDSLIVKGKTATTTEETTVSNKEKKVSFSEESICPKQTSKLYLLQQVIDKQNELEEKLLEMKNKERTQSKTEKDLISKLDEMEQLEEIEDEMDRLEDILQSEDVVEEEDNLYKAEIKRGVSFADEDDSETLELTFKHSEIKPSPEPYDPEKGILKPSDIYTAHSASLPKTTSILKRTKYVDYVEDPNVQIKPKGVQLPVEDIPKINRTVVLKDVVENVATNENKLMDTNARPTSLFKKKRMQNK